MTAQASIWHTLGIASTVDSSVIRRAYATRLKTTQPEDDPEGFKLLRAAYEAALHLARAHAAGHVQQVASADAAAPAQRAQGPADAPAQSQPAREQTHPSQAAQPDPDLLELQQAFRRLHQVLTSDSEQLSPIAQQTLAAILKSPALDNVSLEQQVQYRLAELLAGTLPSSDPLLQAAVDRFGWANPQAQLALVPPMIAILVRLQDLAFLEALQSGRHAYSPAFHALQKRKLPVLGWMLAHVHKAGQPGEFELLQYLRVNHPSLVTMLDPATVTWWDRLASRPQLSFPLLAVGAALAGLASAIGWGAERSLKGGLAMAATFAALLLWKYLLLDWPRVLVRRKWPVAPAWMRVGWLPISVGIVLLSFAFPAGSKLIWLLSIPALAALQWVLIFRPPGPPVDLNSLLGGLLPYVLLVVWWIGLTEGFPAESSAGLFVLVFTLMAASSFGQVLTYMFWTEELTPARRRTILASTALAASGVSALLWFATPVIEWRPACAALVLIVLAVRSQIDSALSGRQRLVLIGWLVAGSIASMTLATHPQMVKRGFLLAGIGAVVTTSAIMCVLMAFWNEWRSARRGVA
jgi:hypothetical protein